MNTQTTHACFHLTHMFSGTAITAALQTSADTNPYIRDIDKPDCSASALGAMITVEGVCWEHVHPH
jgi:hypothetical protein